MRNLQPSRIAFALSMLAFAAFGLVRHDFSVVWQPVPASFFGRQVLMWVSVLVLLGGGIGLLLPRTSVTAGRVLFVAFMAWLLCLRVPNMVAEFGVNTWWATARTACFAGAAWLLWTDQRPMIGRANYGAGLIPFGIAHFLYMQNTAPLVPSYLGSGVVWGYLTGAAFIAAGVAILAGVWPRLAAGLSAAQMGGFTLLVWVPIVLKGAATPFQWAEFVTSVALTAAGWVVMDSYRGKPWLAVGTARGA